MFDEMERMLREIYEETQSIEDIRAARLTANPEHEDAIGMLIDGVFKLSEDIIEPHAAKRGEESTVLKGQRVILPSGMEEVYSGVADMGLLSIIIPEEYKGAGLSYAVHCAVIEIISRADPVVGVSLSIHGSCADAIDRLGTEEAKGKYLPKLASGEHFGAIALTEPGAGSDLRSVKAKAELKNGCYVVNGEKIFISNGGRADYYILLARTCPSEAENELSAFILEKDFSGFRVDRLEEKRGLHASPTASIILNNCEIPERNLLGERGKGLRYVLGTLSGGRISIAAQATGIAQGAHEDAKGYADVRVQFGKKIKEIPAIRKYLSDMSDVIPRLRWIYLDAAGRKDRGEDGWHIDASKAKLLATEYGYKVCDMAFQIFGGYAYTKEYRIGQRLMDARATRIYEGTSEIQRHIIKRSQAQGRQ